MKPNHAYFLSGSRLHVGISINNYIWISRSIIAMGIALDLTAASDLCFEPNILLSKINFLNEIRDHNYFLCPEESGEDRERQA